VPRWEAVALHLPLRSIDFDDHGLDLCGQGSYRCREDVAKAPQLYPENLIMSMISSGVLEFALSGRISNGSIFQSMSSSSVIGFSNWLLSVRVDSSIGVRSATASAWGRRRRTGGTRGRSGLFIDSEQRVLSYPWRHRLAQVGFRARRLIKVMMFSNDRSTDDYVDTAVDSLST
jgi:hypothetical protein